MLVSSYGAVYRISKAEYKRQLQKIVSGEGYDLSDAKCLGELTDITGIDCDEAEFLLKSL